MRCSESRHSRLHGIVSLSVLLFTALPAPTVAHAQEPAATRTTLDLSALQWRNLGPAGVGGRIVDFAVPVQDPDTIYVATAQGGVWKSTDAGISWEPLFDQQSTLSIGSVAVADSNENLVWVGTGEPNGRNLVSTSWGDGVFKSEDGGKTWRNMGLRGTQQIGRIRIHPIDPETVFVPVLGSLWHDDAAANALRGVYRTRDGGRTWDKILSAGEHGGFTDLDLDPRDPDILYAASWQRERRDWSWFDGGSESGLYRSTDGGDSWQRLDNGLPTEEVGRIGVSVCASRPDRVYAVLGGTPGGVFRSEDRGASWERVNARVRTSQYYGQVRCDPVDPDRVYVLETAFWVSHDGGRTFANEMRGKPVHVDHHALWIDARDSDHLLLGNDGGVYLSRDRGEHWRFVDNLPITQFYEIGVDLAEPFYRVYGGTQDNNSYGAPSGTRNRAGVVNDDWFMTIGGDGFYARPDPTDTRIVYTEWQNGNLARFDSRTGERKSIKPADPDGCDDDPATEARDCYRWNWSAPVEISSHDAGTLYFGAQVLFRSRDRGDRWEVMSPDLTRALRYDSPMNDFGTLRVIAESPRDRDTIAVGTDDGLVQITEDGGTTWRRAAPLPGVPDLALVRRIVISSHEPATMYVASSAHEYNDLHPYLARSRDLGRSWERIDAGLPVEEPIRALTESPGRAGVLFAGTERGVLVSLDDGGHWQSLRNNLPTVAIHDVLVHPREHDLVAATHGRGIWILDDAALLDEMAAASDPEQPALFGVRPATQLQRFDRGRGSRGSTYFAAPNPPDGAILDVWLPATAADHETPPATLTIRARGDRQVRSLPLAPRPGLQRLVWDLRHEPAWTPPGKEGRPLRGPWVLPGEYTAELRLGDSQLQRRFVVSGDPDVRISDPDRVLWHATQVRIAAQVAVLRNGRMALEWVHESLDAAAEIVAAAGRQELGDRVKRLVTERDSVADELESRARSSERTYRALQGAVSRPTADQLSLAERLDAKVPKLVARLNDLAQRQLVDLGAAMDAAGLRWSPGRPVRMPGSRQP